MSRFVLRLFALGLALLWVPVTGHCRMEALGLEFGACGQDCHGDRTPDGIPDAVCGEACDLVESGLYKSGVEPLNVAPAAWFALNLFFAVQPATDTAIEPRIYPADETRPRAWLRQWHFVRRAAAPAHAPDSSHV
jgi:hypothetical protein